MYQKSILIAQFPPISLAFKVLKSFQGAFGRDQLPMNMQAGKDSRQTQGKDKYWNQISDTNLPSTWLSQPSKPSIPLSF